MPQPEQSSIVVVSPPELTPHSSPVAWLRMMLMRLGLVPVIAGTLLTVAVGVVVIFAIERGITHQSGTLATGCQCTHMPPIPSNQQTSTNSCIGTNEPSSCTHTKEQNNTAGNNAGGGSTQGGSSGGGTGSQGGGGGSPPPGTPALVYGLDYLPSNMNSTTAYTLVRSSHASVLRVGASWATVQQTQSTYNWGIVDTQTQLATQYDLKLILQLGDTPAWDLPAGANGNTRYVPADCQNGSTCPAVYGYVKALISHLGGSSPVAYIIPRNEVYDTAKNWISGTADDYARYLNAVYRAVHDTGSAIKVMPGGDELIPSSFTASPMYKPGTAAAQFAQALFTNPLFCKSMDVDDIHLGYSGPSWGPKVVDTTEQGLQACAGKSVPIWVTETALTSDQSVQSDSAHTAVLGAAYTNGLGSQAQYLTDTYAALAKDTNVYGISWTFLIDNPGSTDTPNSRYGGLADTNYSPKHVFSALLTYTQ